MKGNQHYTEKQLERMMREPAKDDGWGREPVVRKPSKVESLKAQLDAETRRAEYYAKRASEIEEAQFRLANECDDLRSTVAKLTHERDEALASEKEIYRSYRVIADQREELKSRIAELEAERDRLRKERDDVSVHIEVEQQAHEETKGYRQHAEELLRECRESRAEQVDARFTALGEE